MNTFKKNLLAIAVVTTVFFLQIFNDKINILLGLGSENVTFYWSITAQIIKYVLPVIITLLLFYPPKNILVELGLQGGFIVGLQYAILFTLPMLIGYWIMGEYNKEQTITVNIVKAFKDGVREEIFYRAFLFGQMYRHVKIGFVPAVFMNGLIFGFMHLYQAHSVAESIGVFGITFAGAIWFAWLYIEWQKNLWLPIFMHAFMNFYWSIFSTEHSALGGLVLNLPRIITIAISIFITIHFARKANGLQINKTKLMWQK